jgi:hypothetical protein
VPLPRHSEAPVEAQLVITDRMLIAGDENPAHFARLLAS